MLDQVSDEGEPTLAEGALSRGVRVCGLVPDLGLHAGELEAAAVGVVHALVLWLEEGDEGAPARRVQLIIDLVLGGHLAVLFALRGIPARGPGIQRINFKYFRRGVKLGSGI